MSLLYEIDDQLAAIISNSEHYDPETGALYEDKQAELDALETDSQGLLLDICAEVKNLGAEATAYENEATALSERAKRFASKAKRVLGRQEYLVTFLEARVPMDQTISDERSETKWRQSEYLEIKDEGKLPEGFLRYPSPVPMKPAIKLAIKEGRSVPGATLAKRFRIKVV